MTLHEDSQGGMNAGLHILLAVVTCGLWLPIACFCMGVTSLANTTAGFTCNICGTKNKKGQVRKSVSSAPVPASAKPAPVPATAKPSRPISKPANELAFLDEISAPSASRRSAATGRKPAKKNEWVRGAVIGGLILFGVPIALILMGAIILPLIDESAKMRKVEEGLHYGSSGHDWVKATNYAKCRFVGSVLPEGWERSAVVADVGEIVRRVDNHYSVPANLPDECSPVIRREHGYELDFAKKKFEEEKRSQDAYMLLKAVEKLQKK
ncbi:MAG: hypothetical protein NTY19_22975 [Planctomycetota bacterium]|nr:hypothetical protein [Planctomycetota bacterium]